MRFSLPTFNVYGLSQKIREVLEASKIHTPSSIQDIAIPELLRCHGMDKENNFYLAAQTGTGKTYAYLLPVITMLKREEQEA